MEVQIKTVKALGPVEPDADRHSGTLLNAEIAFKLEYIYYYYIGSIVHVKRSYRKNR